MVAGKSQMIAGKAFEYAILSEFQEKLSRQTFVEVISNNAYSTAKNCFDSLNQNDKGRYLLSASFAVNFLIDIEPRLSNGISHEDILQLEILTDSHGIKGDVRDVLAIRLLQKWEIGISAKNNHHAVKHSRLSNDIDFGKEWIGIGCSKDYFNEIQPVFSSLKKIKIESKSTQKWCSLGDYHKSVYKPILDAFSKELMRIYNLDKTNVAYKLVEYLLGRKDYYNLT